MVEAWNPWGQMYGCLVACFKPVKSSLETKLRNHDFLNGSERHTTIFACIHSSLGSTIGKKILTRKWNGLCKGPELPDFMLVA